MHWRDFTGRGPQDIEPADQVLELDSQGSSWMCTRRCRLSLVTNHAQGSGRPESMIPFANRQAYPISGRPNGWAHATSAGILSIRS